MEITSKFLFIHRIFAVNFCISFPPNQISYFTLINTLIFFLALMVTTLSCLQSSAFFISFIDLILQVSCSREKITCLALWHVVCIALLLDVMPCVYMPLTIYQLHCCTSPLSYLCLCLVIYCDLKFRQVFNIIHWSLRVYILLC